MFDLFYIINHSLKHNIYWFFCYRIKEGKFFFREIFFLQFNWYYLFIYIKSMFESYLPLSTLFLISYFNHMIWNQLSAATATVVTPVVRDNGQLLKMFLRLDFFLNQLIVWVLLTIIYIISHLIFQTYDAKSIFCWHCNSPC